MKPKLYIETSFISYLTGRPSRDLIVAAQQQVTREWWENRRSQFDIYISQIVIQEAKDGNTEAAAKRLKTLEDIPLLDLKVEALELAEKFLGSKALPDIASDDALHIAVAAVYGLDYLLTWNCKHIANAEIQKNISRICFKEGYELPIICTPYELMGG
jgi:predicted nucleic acid-binding protein